MPSKHMLPKGQRRRSVRAEYRATRGVEPPPAPPPVPNVPLLPQAGTDRQGTTASQTILVPAEASGLRLDQYLAQAIPALSRSRVQLLIEQGKVLLGGVPARGKHKVSAGEAIHLTGRPDVPPLAAMPEPIPLHIVYEDEFLAVVDKPAGMAVHAGAAAPDRSDNTADDEADHPSNNLPGAPPTPSGDPRSRGTLVNALLHYFGQSALSQAGGELRPGIVHRLDKQTSGLLLVAKDDFTHRQLGELFSAREVHKTYLALVHGHVSSPVPARTGAPGLPLTVSLPIGRDLVRRTRMTTRRPVGAPGVRSAVSHIYVVERLTTPFGPFTLVRVTIETGRTHQIRVHLQALGNPVVGDTLYGAPRTLPATAPAHPGKTSLHAAPRTLSLPRNFLHAAELRFVHPRTSRELALASPLPPDLQDFLSALQASA